MSIPSRDSAHRIELGEVSNQRQQTATPDLERREADESADADALERRRKALEEVVQFGDPILRSKATEVTVFGDRLRDEVARMIHLMQDGMGIGLAATQVGALRRLLVFQAGPDSMPQAIINPELAWVSDQVEVAEEGCLSIPRVTLDVERALHVRVAGMDERGEMMEIEASGLESRVLQHEIDHLDGVLILDRAPRAQRRAAMRALRRGEPYHPPEDPDGTDAEIA